MRLKESEDKEKKMANLNLSQTINSFRQVEEEYTKIYRTIIQQSKTDPERANVEANRLIISTRQRTDELQAIKRQAEKAITQLARIVDSLRKDINTNY